jgi:hypothetical protein
METYIYDVSRGTALQVIAGSQGRLARIIGPARGRTKTREFTRRLGFRCRAGSYWWERQEDSP